MLSKQNCKKLGKVFIWQSMKPESYLRIWYGELWQMSHLGLTYLFCPHLPKPELLGSWCNITFCLQLVDMLHILMSLLCSFIISPYDWRNTFWCKFHGNYKLRYWNGMTLLNYEIIKMKWSCWGLWIIHMD